jgi:hypothetical protein
MEWFMTNERQEAEDTEKETKRREIGGQGPPPKARIRKQFAYEASLALRVVASKGKLASNGGVPLRPER